MKKQVTEREYERKLKEVLDTIFEVSGTICGWSLNRLSIEAGLTNPCVYALESGKTRFPRFRTIFRLAKAVGMDLYAKEELGIKGKRRAG